VTFDLLVPDAENMAFPDLFDSLPGRGYRGVSVTYPYKEDAARRVTIQDPLVRAIGAVNTVVFDEGGPHGFNTGLYRLHCGLPPGQAGGGPGDVLMIGAGGVGRAIAFGLASLGMTHLRLADRGPLEGRGSGRRLAASSPRPESDDRIGG
jgi:shikimate dehydrogenase